MYYGNDKDFQIKDSWADNQKNNKKKPPTQPQPQILKDAASKALNNYPQITHDILDQHTANIILKDLQLQKPAQKNDAVEHMLNQHKIRNASPVAQKKIQDNDLVGSMASRLGQLERLCNSQKLELKEKYYQIQMLNEEIAELRKYQSLDQSGAIESLKEENRKQKQQMEDMEKFLKEYGIRWVGYEDKDSREKMKQLVKDVSQPKPLFNYHLPKEISIDAISRRIEELNYIMEKEGCNEIVKEGNGIHKFKKLEPIPIGFYKNGISLKGFKFFSYGSNDAYQILADILEGYFPYQLKKQYPNGTPLKVLDKTDEVYDSEKLMDLKQVDMHKIDEQQLKPLTKEEFLNVS